MQQLQKQLGYVFNHPALLQQALTHRSASAVHNERLEFLGDAILGAAITKALYHQFATITEGELSHMRAALVCKKTLAELAKGFFIDKVIIVGSSLLKAVSRLPDTLIVNALEAIIGAIYLDCLSSDVVETLIICWYQPRLEAMSPGYQHKDSKTRLQEHLQRRYQATPDYVMIAASGHAHNKKFKVQCCIPYCQSVFIGEGLSKRSAEQAAAAKALHGLAIK